MDEIEQILAEGRAIRAAANVLHGAMWAALNKYMGSLTVNQISAAVELHALIAAAPFQKFGVSYWSFAIYDFVLDVATTTIDADLRSMCSAAIDAVKAFSRE